MIREVLICCAGLGLSSLLGSALGLLVRRIPHRWNDIFMGLCAGMMLAAAIVCLLLPAVEQVAPSQWWQIIAGIVAGVALIGVLDRITPHLHHLSGTGEQETHIHNAALDRTILFVMAIAIHKLPEGMATGISFNGETGNAIAIAVTIAMQNIPEGMVVVTPLMMAGVKFRSTVLAAVTVAFLEMAGVLLGYLLGDMSSVLLPFMLSLAGGAMLYVISDEIIPETHAHGFQKHVTYSLVAGIVMMLFIESAF